MMRTCHSTDKLAQSHFCLLIHHSEFHGVFGAQAFNLPLQSSQMTGASLRLTVSFVAPSITGRTSTTTISTRERASITRSQTFAAGDTKAEEPNGVENADLQMGN